MNSLAERFGDELAVIGFPTNQFGGETNESEHEILNTLAHVRPGGGYKPRFTMMGKVEVNGKGAHPLFRFLLETLPTVSDDCGGRGADHIIADPAWVRWKPILRSDVGWNFEKFLVNQEGRPVRRYSPYFETRNVAKDIEALVSKGPNALD